MTHEVWFTFSHRLRQCDISLPRPSLCPLFQQAVGRPLVLLQDPLGTVRSSAEILQCN